MFVGGAESTFVGFYTMNLNIIFAEKALGIAPNLAPLNVGTYFHVTTIDSGTTCQRVYNLPELCLARTETRQGRHSR